MFKKHPGGMVIQVDRASSSSIQRVLSIVVNKLVLFKSLKSESNIVIAVRLQSNKRTLRSNDIALPVVSSSDRLDLMLDISFTIQYSHIIKRKSNVVQLLIQRRKKYKNRQIPGFKTLAIGYLNLDEVLQQGGQREVVMWDTSMIKKTDDLNELRGGVIYISNCQTQAVDAEQDLKWNKGISIKEGNLMSEEEIDDDSSQEESDYEANEFDRTPRLTESSKGRLRSRKKLNQKNIKQKIASLLRRFKVPDEENAVLTGCESPTRVLHPTAKELEEIFEELENSDSGPELEPDKMSIVSNPRPGLRPYFGGSKSDILPPIDDQLPSDESSDEQELSSENENQHEELPYYLSHSLAHDFLPSESTSLGNGDTAPNSSRSQKSGGEFHRNSGKEKKTKEPSPERLKQMTHSTTVGSIPSTDQRTLPSQSPSVVFVSGKKEQHTSQPPSTIFIDNMLTQLDDPKSFVGIRNNVWICSNSDFPWISRIDSAHLKTLRLIDCSSSLDVRTAVQTIVGRIQKFCNSNSVSPPQTIIGVMGTDRLVAHLLRSYVDLLQNKSSQDWLNYLRFSLVVPPNSVIGRLLIQVGDGAQLETSWRALSKLINDAGRDGSKFSVNELAGIEECLSTITNASVQRKQVDLPIGEVMLQLTSHEANNPSGDEKDGSQAFVPFLGEIHLGNLEELNSLYYMKNNSTEEAPLANQTVSSSLSPPASPNIDYWTTSLAAASSYPQMGTYDYGISTSTSTAYHQKQPIPEASKLVGGGKFSLKATVRSLSIAREPHGNSLSMLFVKERKKDKVLQKLGRKTKSRGPDSFYSQSRVVSSVTRMICIGKNSELEISIDGVTWKRISFFQITNQWQTHVSSYSQTLYITL